MPADDTQVAVQVAVLKAGFDGCQKASAERHARTAAAIEGLSAQVGGLRSQLAEQHDAIAALVTRIEVDRAGRKLLGSIITACISAAAAVAGVFVGRHS